MTVINTNTAASITANALTKNERAMSQAMERLSTGQRINNAGDDAAGLAIASKMTSQINGLNMAVRNANDAISMVQTEDGALIEVTNMLQRMRELAVQSASGTMSSTDRAALHVEFKNLAGQIYDIGSDTQWNGSNLLDGTPGAASFHVGANASQTVSHTFSQVKVAIASGSTPAAANGTDASGSDEELWTVTLDDGATFAVNDTLTFQVDSIYYSANIDAVDSDGDVSAITFHGSSTQITEAGTENYVVHTATLDANGATTSPAGNIKVNLSNDNVISFEGSLTHADADFTVAATSALNDGTSLANSTASTGIVAGAMFADISTVKGANSALATVDHVLTQVNSARATSGATINRLEYAADNLANVSQNTSASRSQVLDADYASETTELARTQIIQQAATAMLSQANQQAQTVLALLR
jgi:flagellin